MPLYRYIGKAAHKCRERAARGCAVVSKPLGHFTDTALQLSENRGAFTANESGKISGKIVDF